MKSRAIKVLSAISAVLIGMLMCGFGFTSEMEHPISSIGLLFGLGLVFVALFI